MATIRIALLGATAATLLTVAPGFAQSISDQLAQPPPPESTTCQPGQVLLPNGQSCLPPLSLPPLHPTLLGSIPDDLTPPGQATTVPKPICPTGQVLQPNGQTCPPAK